MFLTVVFLAFFILGLLTESMEVVAIVFATIIMAVFIVGIKNEIVKLRKELASKKNLHE